MLPRPAESNRLPQVRYLHNPQTKLQVFRVSHLSYAMRLRLKIIAICGLAIVFTDSIASEPSFLSQTLSSPVIRDSRWKFLNPLLSSAPIRLHPLFAGQ